mmetsp:Transcript_13275/g.42009  ORF Transcript_13275/g.42009 Transcript_13275/m.42009 type:complete len:307 (+) Transcript_13275:1354-2274(+)
MIEIVHVDGPILMGFYVVLLFVLPAFHQQVPDGLVVNLDHRHLKLVVIHPPRLLCELEELVERPKRDTPFAVVAFHGVRLPRTGLAVCKYADIETIHHCLHERLNILEHLLLRRRGGEDPVELEHFLRPAIPELQQPVRVVVLGILEGVGSSLASLHVRQGPDAAEDPDVTLRGQELVEEPPLLPNEGSHALFAILDRAHHLVVALLLARRHLQVRSAARHRLPKLGEDVQLHRVVLLPDGLLRGPELLGSDRKLLHILFRLCREPPGLAVLLDLRLEGRPLLLKLPFLALQLVVEFEPLQLQRLL